MTLGNILTRPHLAGVAPRLTNQNIADFMLEADRARRAAQKAGDEERVFELDHELDDLAAALS